MGVLYARIACVLRAWLCADQLTQITINNRKLKKLLGASIALVWLVYVVTAGLLYMRTARASCRVVSKYAADVVENRLRDEYYRIGRGRFMQYDRTRVPQNRAMRRLFLRYFCLFCSDEFEFGPIWGESEGRYVKCEHFSSCGRMHERHEDRADRSCAAGAAWC